MENETICIQNKNTANFITNTKEKLYRWKPCYESEVD